MTRVFRIFAGIAAVAIWGSAAPITLHPKNPHYFLFGGRTVVLVTSGEHYGAVLNADFDYKRYLSTLAKAGLNYTRLFGGSYVEVPQRSFGIQRNDLAPALGRFVAPWARSQSPGYAGGGNKFDLDHWDSDFFARYRDFLNEAAKQGIAVEVTLFSSQYAEAQWRMSPFHPANNVNGTEAIDWKKLETLENANILTFQERYVRKLVREANGFDNVIFEIQNEPWSDRPMLASIVNRYLPAPGRDKFPNSIDVADDLSVAWQAQVARWINDEERTLPNKHLIAQNYSNFGCPVSQLLPGVQVVNFHYARPDAVVWNYGLGKAISYDETGFLGRDDDTYRQQAWNFMLSGGSTFDNLDYSFSVGKEDGSDTQANGPGGGSTALRQQLHVLSQFLESLPLVELRPDFQTVKHAGGAYARVLSQAGRRYAIYLDGSGPVDVTMRLPAGSYWCSWINTKTGAVERREKVQPLGGGETRLRSPEFSNGIAMRIERSIR